MLISPFPHFPISVPDPLPFSPFIVNRPSSTVHRRDNRHPELRVIRIVRSRIILMDPDRAVAHAADGAPIQVAEVYNQVGWMLLQDS